MSTIDNRALTALLGVALALSLLVLLPQAMEWRLAGIDQGYEPVQPVAFSHRLHAGKLEVPCLYCHSGAEKSRLAGIPALSVCMNCHKNVSAAFAEVRAESLAADKEGRKVRRIVSPEIGKIYAALGLSDALEPAPSKVPAPIAWKRVHNLPDFVYFDHRPHLSAGTECRRCHGPVETMERVRQVETLTMGWCVDCHRGARRQGPDGKTVHASIDCVRCHY